MNSSELAWAAGVFDGEGSASVYLPKGRRSLARQIAVYQGGDGAPPALLLRFQVAVGGNGLIHGPARGYLYQWHSKRHAVVDEVGRLLWPWLGAAKRAQLRRCANAVGHPVPHRRWRSSADELAAWAAGFFDGEGSVSLVGHPCRPAIALSLSQASKSGVPDTLVRFRTVVRAGAISGPRIVPSPWSKLPQYRWELRRFDEIQRVAESLRPHLCAVKCGQLDSAIEHVLSVRAKRSRAR